MRPDSARGVFVSVGSNIAPETNIIEAARALRRHVIIAAVSPLFETPPEGPPNQPTFVNGVWRLETDIRPHPLKFDILRRVEESLGRVRTEDKYAPRPIDLDLIMYNDEIIKTPELVIPDPDIVRFSHIAVPLAAVAPNLVLPGSRQPVSELPCARDRGTFVPLSALTHQLKGILQNG